MIIQNKVKFSVLFIFVLCLFFSGSMAEAGGRFSARGTFQNRAGGISHMRTSGFSGSNGGVFRSRNLATDGQGNVVSGSAGTFNSPSGSAGMRVAETTRSSDGNIQHNSGMMVAGSQGSVQSQGGFSKNADESISGSRETNINSQNGGSYQGSTNYSTSDGVTHAGTCTDAAGNIIPCPGK